MTSELDRDVIALGVRQPWAELIIRGVKTIEVRSRPTSVRGPIYIYAARKTSPLPDAAIACREQSIDLGTLPTGMIVGRVEIVACRIATSTDSPAACVSSEVLSGQQAWLLDEAIRLDEPVKPRFLPYGVWFYPFKRRSKRSDGISDG